MTSEKQDIITQLKKQTIAFVDKSANSDSKIPYCTGVWITEKHILTAKHCVVYSDPTLIMLVEQNIPIDLNQIDLEYVVLEDIEKIPDNKIVSRQSRSVFVDEHQDLAIIEAKGSIPKHPVVNITTISPSDGDEVHIIGHTMMMWWTYLHGYVSATRDTIYDVSGNATKALQIASPAYKGNSGGGAFNKDGQLVGIISWVNPQSPEMNFFIHRDEIIAFIARSQLGR